MPTPTVVDQKRIARNTLMLYFRMGLMMLVGLYTSRVVLDALGVDDMGIYSSVGGVVMALAFLSNTMSSACQRFYAYAMGQDDSEGLRRVVSLCVEVFAAIAVLVVLLCETAGLWFLHTKIDISGRTVAADWVFQCAVLSLVFTILRMPFQGMVVTKEKMKVFAYISIAEALGSLAIALLLARFGGDRLVLYAVLMMLMNTVVTMLYIAYCIHFYPECRVRFYWDKQQFMEILSFAGWNMIGSLSSVCKSQGLTVLLNIFFGNAVVAARHMAYKVYATLQQFSENFVMAIKPQIIKSYSAGDCEGMYKLIYQGSKFSYFLLLIVSLPILIETPAILDIWLKEVPALTVVFTRLVIINSLVEVLVTPLATAMQAYGRIRNYQLAVGGMLLLILPVAYLALKGGCDAPSVFWVSIIISVLAMALRVVMIHHYTGLSIRGYARSVVWPIVMVTILSTLIPVTMEMLMADGIVRLLVVCTATVLMTAAAAFILGLTKTERKHLLEEINKKLHKA